MHVLKLTPLLLLILIAKADKKIELQDIEEDNLKSEKEKESEKDEYRQSDGSTAPGLTAEDFLKNGLLRYFERTAIPQQPRYVQQYAVTEQPESRSAASAPSGPGLTIPKPQYGPPTAQQALVGYLSNTPMQIYLVPRYEANEPAATHPQTAIQYSHVAPAVSQVTYPSAPEAVQQSNYIEVPAYYMQSGKTLFQPYPTTGIAYVTYAPQTLAQAQSTVGPVVAYQMPAIASSVAPKGYYQYYTENNNIEDVEEVVDNPKHYATQTEAPYTKSSTPEYPRYYNSRAPISQDQRHGAVSELPPPNPLLLKHPPPHLAHLPKALPMFRPLSKPIYASGGYLPSAYTPRPSEAYALPFKRRPNSLLDSYIPSGVQLEYMKRGFTKDPLQAYEALSRGHHHQYVMPRHYERGFLPNQMYHTAGGGITYGHYKRNTKGETVQNKK